MIPAVTRPVWELPAHLPRHAFSARDAARAGDVWRAFQEVAVSASSMAGWPPRRFAEVGTAFVVRSMTVVHHRETWYGEPLRARTWVWRFRRDMMSSREVRLFADDEAAGALLTVPGTSILDTDPDANTDTISDDEGLAWQPDGIASGTQEWVHIDLEKRTPVRAPASVVEAFPAHGEDGPVELPMFASAEGKTHVLEFKPWHVDMDPLGHANHPAYVDWCDEATSRVMVEAGIDPLDLVPVAEQVVFRGGVHAGEQVRVETRPVGVTAEGALALRHRIRKNDGERAADATTVRALLGGDAAALRQAFEAQPS